MDVFWFQNLWMDLTAYLAVNYFLKRGKRLRRIFLASFVLALATTIALLCCRGQGTYRLLTHLAFVPATTFLAFGRGRGRMFLENWGVSFLMMLLLGGIREWVWEHAMFSRGGVLEYAGTLSVFLGILIYLSAKRTYGAGEYQVKLWQGETELSLTAYLDSGNGLRDIYSKKPVHIIAAEQAKKLFLGRKMMVRYIPYTALGKTDGLIRVVTVDEMVVTDGKKEKKILKAVLGLAEMGELEGQTFEMILHGGVWQEE